MNVRWYHNDFWRNGIHELRCTMPTLDDNVNGGEGEGPLLTTCDEAVWLEWTVLLDPSFAYADDKEAGAGAFNSGWKMTCAAGHTLVVSSQEDRSAPPYSPELVGLPPEPKFED